MITKITSLKELPYKDYTAFLLKSDKDLKPEDSGYLYVSESPKMTILFTEFVQEISGKVSRQTRINV